MTTHDAGSEPTRTELLLKQHRLASQIEDQITARASGRITDLHVVCSADSVVLQGRARSYHVKQLAQEAALDLMDRPLGSDFVNQIIVA